MTVSRIVLDSETRSTVDRIQQVTRSTSPSAAIALMISRYGRHLLETWELTSDRYPEPAPEQYLPTVAAVPASTEFRFDEPIDL